MIAGVFWRKLAIIIVYVTGKEEGTNWKQKIARTGRRLNIEY